LEGLGIEKVVIFDDNLDYLTAIWYNLQIFDIVRGHLVHFSVLVNLDQENLATLLSTAFKARQGNKSLLLVSSEASRFAQHLVKVMCVSEPVQPSD
jgi:hypothetical protein